jgi:hypothetical protein
VSARSGAAEITHKAKLNEEKFCEKPHGKSVDKTSCFLKFCKKGEFYVISEFIRAISAVDFTGC